LNEFKFPIPEFPGLGGEGLEFESLGHVSLVGIEFESSVFRGGLKFEALVSEMSQLRGVVSEVLGLSLGQQLLGSGEVDPWSNNILNFSVVFSYPLHANSIVCLDDKIRTI
jgi:hypothetical protein